MKLPEPYLEAVLPFIEKARGFLEKGESLSPIAFVGNFASGRLIPVVIDTASDEAKDNAALAIRMAAESVEADFVFTVMEGWGLPKDKVARYEEIIERYGSIGACPWKVDTANFMLETRHGVWGAQVTLKPKPPSKKRRTFAAPVSLTFMDGVEGRFVGLLPDRVEPGTKGSREFVAARHGEVGGEDGEYCLTGIGGGRDGPMDKVDGHRGSQGAQRQAQGIWALPNPRHQAVGGNRFQFHACA
ncbi:MAG: hypothetical protein IPG33_11295 [Betaproteobacteria bacterium]|nr:hypothetical protein [Betaproteobacteria bacterium]